MDEFFFETAAIRTQLPKTAFEEHSTPLYLTSSFTFENPEEMAAAFASENDHQIYSRFDNPNFTELCKKIAQMEGAESAFAVASGMSAIYSSICALAQQGDHIISCRSIFGSTHTVFNKYLPKFGIETTYIDIDKPSEWTKVVQKNSKFLFLESPTNPGIDIVDLEKICNFGKSHNLIVLVDNCFATPYLQQPLLYGADLVVHSATKFLDGQGRVVGGIVAGKASIIEEIKLFCRSTGPCLSPFNAWMLSKSLETLAVRMDRHCENALELAIFLENLPEIINVKYPFLKSHPHFEIAKKQMKKGGGLISFELKYGYEAGKSFLSNLKMCSLTANLGDCKTIVTHPASTTHAKLSEEEQLLVGITPGMIRISVGLEHIEDIKKDILMALTTKK